MCVIIDACCLARVFDGDNKEHAKFAPVLKWVSGKGCMVYGGTKYNRELGKLPKYLSLVNELKKSRRAVPIPDAVVDGIAMELKKQYPEPQFNDEHIAALVIASRCAVVCTIDASAISYLRLLDIFKNRGVGRPSIFRGHNNHERLCCDQKIVGICRERA